MDTMMTLKALMMMTDGEEEEVVDMEWNMQPAREAFTHLQ